MAFYTLRRIRLNSGGYDSTGSYWGHGQPLYEYEQVNNPDNSGTLRASTREAAKRHIWDKVDSGAQFFR